MSDGDDSAGRAPRTADPAGTGLAGAAPTPRIGVVARVLVAPIRFYQRFITPYTPATCRYYPTCSAYAVTALRRHGALRGSWLALRRLGRCHPWSAGGVDHVPPARERRAAAVSSSHAGVCTAASERSGAHGATTAPRFPARLRAARLTDRSPAA